MQREEGTQGRRTLSRYVCERRANEAGRFSNGKKKQARAFCGFHHHNWDNLFCFVVRVQSRVVGIDIISSNPPHSLTVLESKREPRDIPGFRISMWMK